MIWKIKHTKSKSQLRIKGEAGQDWKVAPKSERTRTWDHSKERTTGQNLNILLSQVLTEPG